MSAQVSIIIPVYNDKLVVDAVESALNQTYKNIEIIVIDDGSEPFVANILTPYLPDIRYYRTANKGAAAARNKGIELAQGQYVAFLDADDIFLPNKIEKQVDAMIAQSALFSYTGYQRIDCATRKVINTVDFENNEIHFPDIISECIIATPTVMLNKNILKGNTLFDEEISIGEDVCAWIDIAHDIDFMCVHDILTLVRVDEYTCVNNPAALKKGLLNIINHVAEKYGDYPEYIQKLIFSYGNLFSITQKSDPTSTKFVEPLAASRKFSKANLKKALNFYRQYGIKRRSSKILEKLFRLI